MSIKLTGIYVDDQDTALAFSTDEHVRRSHRGGGSRA